MAEQLLPLRVILRDDDATGTPLSGGSVTYVSTGTTTPVSITDAAGTPLANPQLADSLGRVAPAYYVGASEIDAIVKDSAGAIVETISRIPKYAPTGDAAASVSFTPAAGIAAANVQDAIEELADDIAAQSLSTAQRYATYDGTANAITLTTGANLAALVVGMAFRFRATSANTGATTINLDGLGAQSCVTVTLAALPSGYIRTDVETVCWWNGSAFVLDRIPERGGTVSSGNGSWNRLADGTQSCEVIADDTAGAWTTATSSMFMRTTAYVWTYSKAFVATPAVAASAERAADLVMGCALRSPSTTGVSLNPWASTSLAAGSTTKAIHAIAKGRWYA